MRHPSGSLAPARRGRALLLAALCVWPTAGWCSEGESLPAAVLTFHERAAVADEQVRLGDVALIETEDRALAQQLAAVVVGAAPLVGRTRSLSAAYCRVRLRAAGINVKALAFGGAALVEVLRQGQTVAGADLLAAALAEAERQRASDQVAYLPANRPDDLTVPLGQVALTARVPAPTSGSVLAVPVSVSVDGHPVATRTVHLRIARRAPVLVLVRDLPAGALLTPEDVALEERPVLPGPGALSAPDEVRGMQLAQAAKAGTVLTASLVRAAILVKRGARVRLICRTEGFVISCPGEALADGTRGRPVRVRNLTSRQEVVGTVVDRDLVEVPF